MATKLRFDEMNSLGEYLKNVEADQGTIQNLDADFVVDALLDILIMEYVLGTEQAGESLGEYFVPDGEKMNNAIYKRIEGKNFADRVREYVASGDVPSIMRVAETDGTRVYNDAVLNAGLASGIPNVKKRWETMLDDRVRDTHNYLQGMTVPIGEKFFTFDGDSARYPTDFAKAQNNIGCRCAIDLIK